MCEIEEEKINIAYVLGELIQKVRRQRESATDSETARRLAIIVTEMEKIYAFAFTYFTYKE